MDKLRSIGFYTLEDKRAKETSIESPLWRCELLLTSRCNFKCPYCRGMKPEDQGDISFEDACKTVNLWCDQGLKNIRFSGGEPTLWKGLVNLVHLARNRGVERIAISTNGSAPLSMYVFLVEEGVNDISISLDSCCAATGNKMAGGAPIWEEVVNNIKELSKLTYVTVGTVLTEDNEGEIDGIIRFADTLNVSDIRLITAAQRAKFLPDFSQEHVSKYPILKYRLNNFKNGRPIRGIGEKDNHRCPLVLDDMAVLNNKHYPCIIYLREQGAPIGNVGENMRLERVRWYLKHDCYKDKICKNNCLDVCVDYNNRAKELNDNLC